MEYIPVELKINDKGEAIGLRMTEENFKKIGGTRSVFSNDNDNNVSLTLSEIHYKGNTAPSIDVEIS